MGLMPPYDPFGDTTLAWAIARVVSVEPSAPTWSRPALVVLDVEEVLRGAPPTRLEITFGRTREAGQHYFYLARELPPVRTPAQDAELARQTAQLDATPVEVPAVGVRIVVWLGRTSDGRWDIPTLRALGAPMPPSMRSRWLDGEPATVALVRARLG